MHWFRFSAVAVLIGAGFVACAGKTKVAPSDAVAKPQASSQPSAKSPTKTASKKPATTKAAALTDAEAAARAATGPLIPTPHPVPLLTPEEEIKTFKLPPGLHAEMVACEPMVQHPIACVWDPDGRLWVCEMRGYMQQIDGKGEDQPSGRISVLEDTDGDGRMDKSTVFLNKLVMPRAISLVRDGLLVGVPPKLIFARDTNHDLVADDVSTIVAKDYGDGLQPEHQANGLMMGLDNWIYNADYGKRFRFDQFKWQTDYVRAVGQYGITQDDVGRIYTDSNSDYLRCNYIPVTYASRGGSISGIYAQVDKDQNCWPAHETAENRGYRPAQLRNGRLATFTAACSPWIYRGDLLPREYYGNAFVCESSANFIRRAVLTEKDGVVTGANPYDKDEFFTSTYERFRPCAMSTGPDGALYVVDMHHGLIQHAKYITPYLKAQYLARELDKHLMTGRIFRVVPDGAKPRAAVKMSAMNSAQLVEQLASANSWNRETAQRLLVERNKTEAVAPLRAMVQTNTNPLARMHALWTLEGMHRNDAARIRIALNDGDPRVRAQAIRVAEPVLLSPQRDALLSDVLKLANDADASVRLQFALTVSAVGTPATDATIAQLLSRDTHNALIRDGALSGLRGRELDVLEKILADPAWAAEAPGRGEVLADLTEAIMDGGKGARTTRLFDLAATQEPFEWKQMSLLDGITAAMDSNYRRKPLVLSSEPTSMLKLANDPNNPMGPALAKLMNRVAWIGKPGYVPPPPPRPLTSQEQERFNAGQQVYNTVCIQCHKADGLGAEGFAPPLAESEWILGIPKRPISIVLHGLSGPITVNDQKYNLDMPAWNMLTDQQIADVLTFARRSWDNDAEPIDAATVTKIRAETANHADAWSEKELLMMK